jgi:hypothetical protein
MSQRASHKLGAQFSVTISMDGSRQEPEEQKHQSGLESISDRVRVHVGPPTCTISDPLIPISR